MIPYKTCLQAPVFPKSTQAMKRPRRIFQDYESLPSMLTGTQWCVRPFIGVLSVIAHCALRSSSSLFLQSCTVPNHRHISQEHDKLPPAKPVVKVIKKGICTKGDNWIFSLCSAPHCKKCMTKTVFPLNLPWNYHNVKVKVHSKTYIIVSTFVKKYNFPSIDTNQRSMTNCHLQSLCIYNSTAISLFLHLPVCLSYCFCLKQDQKSGCFLLSTLWTTIPGEELQKAVCQYK